MDRASRPWRRWLWPGLTLLVIVLTEIFVRGVRYGELFMGSGIVLAPAIFVAIYAAFAGGLAAGLVSAALLSAYSVYFLSDPGTLLSFSDPQRRARVVLIPALIFALTGLVGYLKRREDRQHEAALRAEREKNRALEERNSALRDLNETLDSFSYVISHDLKEPVRALVAYSETLASEVEAQLSEGARDLVRRNAEAAERLARLVSGLIEFSRAARVEGAPRAVLTASAVAAQPECLARYENFLRERGAALTVEDGPPFVAPIAAACQVVGNLVLNAIQHNDRASPRVRLVSRPYEEDAAMVEVVVEDNGPGFAEPVAAQFSSEKRAQATSLQSGFGLLIARRVAERLGGRLWASRSESLGGAAVHVLFPAAGAQDDRDSRSGDGT